MSRMSLSSRAPSSLSRLHQATAYDGASAATPVLQEGGVKGLVVLVVDDDEAVRAVSASTLRAYGYRVETAGNAAGALDAVRRSSFDVIVSDILMPGMSGMGLVAQLRKDGFRVPVVLVTGEPALASAVEAIEHGVLRYLAKPVLPRELVVAVNDAVRLDGIARAERSALDNAALRSLVAALRESQEAALAGTRAKNEFLSKMGHELRTPLNVVLGMTSLALDTELDSTQRNYLENAKSAAESLLTVIVHVLEHAALEGGKGEVQLARFSVREALSSTLGSHVRAAEAKGLALILDVGQDVPEALIGDHARFREVFDAILDNAIKFTAHGEVRVSARLKAHAQASEARLCIAVSDTGIGMEPDALARVLGAFSQADNSSTRPHGGAGLGLTIASELMALMGGSLKIESIPGDGTTVRMILAFPRVATDDGFVVDSYGATDLS